MSQLRAGVAKVEITADVTKFDINDPLFAKALVIENGNTQVVIMTMDIVAVASRTVGAGYLDDSADDFLVNLRNKVQTELGISNVTVCASHTHPLHGKLVCDDEQQIIRVFDAVKRAKENLQPVAIGCGIAREDRISINRTMRLKDGTDWTIRMGNPCPPNEDVAELGPIDPDVGIIRVCRLDGSTMAVVYNFGCHLLNAVPKRSITADYPGFASKLIEQTLGSNSIAMFIQGAGGDVCEVFNKDTNRPKNSEDHGTILGATILKALNNIELSTDVELKVITESIKLPRRTDFDQVIRKLEKDKEELVNSMTGSSLNFEAFLPLYMKHLISPEYPSDYAYRYLKEQSIGSNSLINMDEANRRQIAKYIANIRAMEKVSRILNNIDTLKKHRQINIDSGETTIDAEVSGIRIGDCVMITSPAEVLVDIGLNIKKTSPYKHTFVASISNGYLHYSPPAAYYSRGGYEVTECLLAPQWQEIFENKAMEIIRNL
jgi:hypothetical protein